MSAFKDHIAHHPSHMAGCATAAVLVVVAIVFSVPVLALVGVLLCGAMMIAMVWMMFSMMASKHRELEAEMARRKTRGRPEG